MAKVKNKRNADLADKLHRKKKSDIHKKKLNPFEVHINREKIKVLGKKSKHDRGLPGVSRAKAIQKRKETLGTEMKLMHKTNAFIDRRIGEKNNQLSAEDRMVARFAAERAKQHNRKSIYNLADDEILTHRGQTLEQIEKFDDPRSSDDEDEEKKFGGLDNDFVADGHFGGGILTKSETRDGAKSHKDLIEQLIAESKKRKAEKQKEKEQTLDLTEKLDNEWKDLQPVVFKKQKVEEESLIDKLLKNAEKGQDYDKMMRELRFEKRGTPSDGLKSKEKIEEEEKKKIGELEKQRQQRMFSEEEMALPRMGQATTKHRSADDLDDNFDLGNEQDFMLAYDKDGKPLVPEHILKHYSVPNARKKFEDGVSDTSEEEEEDGDDENEEESDEENDSDNEESDKSKVNNKESGDKKGINKKEIDENEASEEEEGSDDKEDSDDEPDEDDVLNDTKSKETSKKSQDIETRLSHTNRQSESVINKIGRIELNNNGTDNNGEGRQPKTTQNVTKKVDVSFKDIYAKKFDALKQDASEDDVDYVDDDDDCSNSDDDNSDSEDNTKDDTENVKLDKSPKSDKTSFKLDKKSRTLNNDCLEGNKNKSKRLKLGELNPFLENDNLEGNKNSSKRVKLDEKSPTIDGDNIEKNKRGTKRSKADEESSTLDSDNLEESKKSSKRLKLDTNIPTLGVDSLEVKTKSSKRNPILESKKESEDSSEEETSDESDNDADSKDGKMDVFEEFDGSDEKIGSYFDVKSAGGFNLNEILSGKSPIQQSDIIGGLIKKYNPSLGENNKETLTKIYAHLLQYVNDIFTNLTNEGEILKSFLIFDRLVPHFYDLAHTNKVSSKKFILELLKEKHDIFKCNQKKVPDLDTLIFFKLISVLYPTSDFRHPVTTPSLIFMTEILRSSRFRDPYSVSRGLFVVSLILEYTFLSKRYVPSAVNFLRGIFYLCANTSVLNPVQVVPPFRLHRDIKILNLERDCSKLEIDSKMAIKDLITKDIDDSFKIRCLVSSVIMLKEFFNNYNDLEALKAIFEPHIQLIARVELELYPRNIEMIVSGVVQYIKESLEVKTYSLMAREKVKPKALRLYEPDVQEVFTGSKNAKLSKENAERVRMQGKYKKEMKGALREIRRDKAYVAAVKIRQKIQSDNVRKDKVKQIYKDASIQQGELNKLKRVK